MYVTRTKSLTTMYKYKYNTDYVFIIAIVNCTVRSSLPPYVFSFDHSKGIEQIRGLEKSSIPTFTPNDEHMPEMLYLTNFAYFST